MSIRVVPYSAEWPRQFERVAEQLRAALHAVPTAYVEHVGSTSVPGLAAKPILDIDVLVPAPDVAAAVAALIAVGYRHRGDLGVRDREAFTAPDDDPRRHVYVCTIGTLNVRNHLAVRDILRQHTDLRDRYAAIKLTLAQDPDLTIEDYLAGKSEIIQEILALSDLTSSERHQIWVLNTAGASAPPAGEPPARDRSAERQLDRQVSYAIGRRLAARHGWREKVLAYVTRAPHELLVFEHTAEYSDAGIQVPAGGVEPGEDPAAAVVREVTEETGLHLGAATYLTTYEWLGDVPSRIRHFYWLQAPADTPDAWPHRVTGSGGDLGMTFLMRFTSRADPDLIRGYGYDSGLAALSAMITQSSPTE